MSSDRFGFGFVCGLYFWVNSVFRFRLRSDCRRFGGLQSGASGFSMGQFRGGFRSPRTAGAAHPGASGGGRHGRQGTGRGVPPSGCRWSKAGANALLAVKMLPRKQALGRLPRLEGLPRCSRLTQKYEPHPSVLMPFGRGRGHGQDNCIRIFLASYCSAKKRQRLLQTERRGRQWKDSVNYSMGSRIREPATRRATTSARC